jgi:OPA family sugar phosphate sensor protein UhpC-like MFS transporter
MSVLDVFRPAPVVDEIQDPELIKKNYRYWRLRTFYAMWVGYAFFYFTRKSFTYAMPMMQSELGLGKFELGLLGSILYITYGASKFLSGILGDKSNPRYFMSIGLILTGVFNFLFGLSSYFWAFALFWGLNGVFQGWGWPGCAKLLTHWYSQKERGRWWSLWNTSHNIGGSLIPLLVAACAEYFGWRYAMYIPGVFCVIAGLFIMNRLRDTPQSLGLPPIEKFRDDYPNSHSKHEKSHLSAKEILFEYVIKNKYIWILAVAYFLIYVIRTAINDWSMVYLIEVKNYSMKQAGVCLFWFEWGGLFGSLTAGWASDLIFKGKRNPINILFTVVVTGLIVAFKMLDHLNSPLLDSAFIFLFGFFIFGPQMLIGMAAAELSHKKATATATGFIGCFAYLGAAVAGGPLGAITQSFGWDVYLLTLLICGALGAMILLPLWSIKTNPKELPQEATT